MNNLCALRGGGGVGASLTEEEIALWEQEHIERLSEIAPAEFDILHYGVIDELKKTGIS